MYLYRIAKKGYIKDLSGTGAKLYGGRWNRRGTPLLYFAESRSLAALETLVHVSYLTLPPDLQLLTAEVHEALLLTYARSNFTKMTKAKETEHLFKEAGEKWITSAKSLGLIVPSIIIPGDHNILINPMHPDMSKLKTRKIEDFVFDARIFGQ